MEEKNLEELQSENQQLREENKMLRRKIADLELLLDVYRADLSESVEERKYILSKLIEIAEDIATSIVRDEEEEKAKPN